MKRALLVVLLAGVFAMPLHAETRDPAGICIISTVVQDTNRWEIWKDNRGRFVTPRPGSNPGGFWRGRNYIFGAGIWVGAIDTARTPPDTQVTWGYNTSTGLAEFCPAMPNGDTTGAITDSLARVYRSDIPRDTAQWPLRDSTGRAIYVSHQDLWTIFNDVNPRYMVPPDSSIGIQVIRRSFAWNSPGPWGDIVKIEHEVKNVTGRFLPPARTLRKVIIGLCLDSDLGYHADETCYLDRTTGSPYPNLAAQYQLVQEPGWGPPPYYLGIKFVEGPVNNAGDTLRIRSQPVFGYPEYDHDIPPGQPLGLTAFQIFDISYDPSLPGQRYLELSGRDYRTPSIYNAYQRDTLGPADRRFLMSCGPFDLPNDSSVKVVIHIIAASDSLDLIRKAELVGVEAPSDPVETLFAKFTLYPVFPNPSSGFCLIRYALAEASPISLGVYDISGRLIRELDGGVRSPGVHSVFWDGRDGKGGSVSSGVYLFRLEAGRQHRFQRAVLFR